MTSPAAPPPRRSSHRSLAASRRLAVALVAIVTAFAALLRSRPPGPATLYPACLIHCFLHVRCPGCGGTHALAALLQGHPLAAWHANALVLCLLPLSLLYVAVLLRRLWTGHASLFPRLPTFGIYSLLAVTACFTLARNLPL